MNQLPRVTEFVPRISPEPLLEQVKKEKVTTPSKFQEKLRANIQRALEIDEMMAFSKSLPKK